MLVRRFDYTILWRYTLSRGRNSFVQNAKRLCTRYPKSRQNSRPGSKLDFFSLVLVSCYAGRTMTRTPTYHIIRKTRRLWAEARCAIPMLIYVCIFCPAVYSVHANFAMLPHGNETITFSRSITTLGSHMPRKGLLKSSTWPAAPLSREMQVQRRGEH